MKRTLIIIAGLAMATVTAFALTSPSVQELHKQAIVIDTHSDTIMRLLDNQLDFGKRGADGHMDLPRLKEGGVDAQVFACWTNPKIGPEKMAPRVLKMIDALYQTIDQYPDQIELATTAGDIRRISDEGKVAAILAIEGGHAIGADLGLLRMFRKLGVISMTLTWGNNNEWADGSGAGQPGRDYGLYYGSIKSHNGLTDFGRDVIREMNRIKMIVDISHVSDKTFWDVIELTTAPVIASHSCAWAINPHFRNMKDDMLQALAKNGGVIGLNFFNTFLLEDDTAVDIGTVVDHIDHIVKVAGIDHVGLGSDFDGVDKLPDGLEDCSKMPAITAELIRRGYSDVDIKKILGGNFLRVIEAVIGSEENELVD
jgi:membrane dipeptidase